MKQPFTYVVLRYVHDIFTAEFVNVGLLLFCPQTGFVQARMTRRLARASSVFPGVDRRTLGLVLRHLDRRFAKLSKEPQGHLDRSFCTAADIARTVLAFDHSGLQWSELGSGLTGDPSETFDELYIRLISRFEEGVPPKRDEREIWKPVESVLRERRVLHAFQDKVISYGDFAYHFDHAWKNDQWHLLQPLSFDLQEKATIVDKALHWSARVNELRKSDTPFRIYFLVGAPSAPDLQDAFRQAERTLETSVAGQKAIVPEAIAQTFASEFADQVIKHG